MGTLKIIVLVLGFMCVVESIYADIFEEMAARAQNSRRRSDDGGISFIGNVRAYTVTGQCADTRPGCARSAPAGIYGVFVFAVTDYKVTTARPSIFAPPVTTRTFTLSGLAAEPDTASLYPFGVTLRFSLVGNRVTAANVRDGANGTGVTLTYSGNQNTINPLRSYELEGFDVTRISGSSYLNGASYTRRVVVSSFILDLAAVPVAAEGAEALGEIVD